MKITVVGRGKVGSALHARASEAHGLDATLLSARRLPADLASERDTELVVLAVPDDAIAATARALDPSFAPGVPFVHCAGTMPAEMPLDGARPTGAMHPIVSFARPTETRVAGRTFSLRGAPPAVHAAEAFTRALGAIPVHIDAAGPAYHAASAIAANGAVALVHAAVTILADVGMEPREAHRAMAGLLHSVADNVESLGVPAALTGPVSRGDVAVVRAHRDALPPEAREVYDRVSSLVLRVAIARGLPDGAAEELASLFESG